MIRKGALSGIKVLEFAGLAPAPYCGMLLSEFGADVILIEREGNRHFSTPFLSRGKRSMSINLKAKSSEKILHKMVEQVDVVIDPYRPGVLERYGLGPNNMLEVNERLIYARLTGWGQDGPLSSFAGHDINYLAISGALSAFCRKGEKPLAPVNYLADFAGGGLSCAFGILLALVERGVSQRGQIIDCSMLDSVNHMSSFLLSMSQHNLWDFSKPGTNLLDSGAPFYDVYECSDGAFLAVGAIEPEFYGKFIEGLGLDSKNLPNQMDTESWDELGHAFTKVIKTKTRREWELVFKDVDACVTPVLSMQEAKNHPHMIHRGLIEKINGVFCPKPSPSLSRSPGIASSKIPNLGEHNKEILKEFNIPYSFLHEDKSKL